jgi:hypothetical protein
MEPAGNPVETPEATPAQPQPEQPEVTTPETPAEATNEPNATDVPADPNAPAPEAPAPTPEAAPEQPEATEDADDDFRPDNLKGTPPTAVDIQQYIDEQGNLDLAGFQAAQAAQTQSIVQAAVEQARQERAYEKTWDKAYDAYPELRKDKELRNMVQAIHANSPQTGKYLSPKQAAEKLFGLRGQAKAEGIKAAQETRTVQAAASLGQSTAAATTPAASSKVTELRSQRDSATTAKGREEANAALLKELIQTGAI